MKRLFKIGAAAMVFAALLGLPSCGGKNAAKLELKPEIEGLSEFMQFESDAVAINLDETSDGVKLYSTIQVKVSEAVASDWSFRFDAEVLDEDMNKIGSLPSDFEIESKSDYDNDLHNYLAAGNYRMVYEVEASKKQWDEDAQETWEKIKKKGKYLVLKPGYSGAKFKAYKGTGESSDSSDSFDGVDTIAEVEEVAEVVSSSAGSEDWDKILDEYESYCTKAAACAKKAMNGDMSAMSEYTSLLESAQSLQNKLENASGNLTAAQAARLSKIAAKMSSALM